MNTVVIKIRMDSEGCAREVKKTLEGVKGAKKVEVDLKQQKATVSGFVEAKKVLKAAQATKKKPEPWPYVPSNFVRETDTRGVATLNPVEEQYTPIATLNPVEEKYTLMFNDENVNAYCSIM